MFGCACRSGRVAVFLFVFGGSRGSQDDPVVSDNHFFVYTRYIKKSQNKYEIKRSTNERD
jgi:hypothetical protein